MPWATRAAAAAIERVRVHRCWRGEHNGKRVWFKRRRLAAAAAIVPGNAFFAAAGSPIRMFTDTDRWLRHERSHWQRLRGVGSCGWRDQRTLWMLELPGVPLGRWLSTASPPAQRAACAAAGRALAAFHQHPVAPCHADLHANNILYDPASDTAQLIDFDTQSVLAEAHARQADDLALLLVDLCRHSDEATWAPLTAAVLGAAHNMRVRAATSARIRRMLEPSRAAAAGAIMQRLRLGPTDPTRVAHALLGL